MKHPTAAFDQSAVGALAQSKFGSDQGVSRGGEEWAGVDALVATHLMRHVAGLRHVSWIWTTTAIYGCTRAGRSLIRVLWER